MTEDAVRATNRARAMHTIGIVAGEASGDLLGAHLVRALRERLPQARFVGIAGPGMRAAGVEALFPMEKLAVRGYVEVMRHYFGIIRMRQRLARHFLAHPPDLFIGIDAPDFNLALEETLKLHGIPTAHYVSPSIWAWRGGRIRRIKRAVDMMLALFPFEPRIYEAAGVPVAYVGHPLADMLGDFPGRHVTRAQLRLPASARIVALLPGSRVSELDQMADLFIATAQRLIQIAPDTKFVAPLVNRETRDLFEAAMARATGTVPDITILSGHAHEAMSASDVVLVASGTATLEAALLRRPMVIAYRMPTLSWWIMRNRSYLPYVGLPNILAGEFLVPEYLQDAATPGNLAGAVLTFLSDPAQCARLEARFTAMLQELRQSTGEKAVAALLPLLARAN